jgi:hypothetical protein
MRFKTKNFKTIAAVQEFVHDTLKYAKILVSATNVFNKSSGVLYARAKLKAIADAQALLDQLSAQNGGPRNADETNALRRQAMSALLKM